MTYLERLRDGVLAEIASGRLGEPVFARLVLAISADHGHLMAAAAAGVSLCEEILRTSSERVHALGSVETGHLSAQVDLAGGKSALIAVSPLIDAAPRLDLFVVGNHGTLQHGPPAETLSLELGTEASSLFTETDRARSVRRAVEASLRSRRPVRPGQGG